MITVHFVSGNSDIQSGDSDLIEAWRRDGGWIWIDIEQNVDDSVKTLLKSFDCHELAIKDVERDRHPPKVEWFEDHTFIIFRGLTELGDNLHFKPLQLSLFVGAGYLVSIHT